jgi:hypothetical protein
MPPQQPNTWTPLEGDESVEELELAATEKYGRSPHILHKAVPSRYPSPLPWPLQFLARLTALIVPALFYIGPAMLMAPLYLLPISPRSALLALLIDIALAFVPVKEWPFFRHYFQLWYDLFDFHHNLDIDMDADPSKNKTEDSSLLIYSTHPHGVIPIHGYLWCAFCDQHFPNRYGFGALTDIAMRLPLLRHVMSWLSSTSATKKVLLKRMNVGDNLYILPGGVSEIFLACPGRQHHVIKTPRRGLMKLALETGAVLVPIYVFGANDFYSQLATYESSSTGPPRGAINDRTKRTGQTAAPTNPFGKAQRRISRVTRGGFTFFWGQYGSPLPFEVKCSMVLGDPLEPVPGTLGQERTVEGNKMTCKKISNPTEEQIDELLYRYTDALIRLFEQYKAQAGYPDAKLIFE